jgi:hypothetical protein
MQPRLTTPGSSSDTRPSTNTRLEEHPDHLEEDSADDDESEDGCSMRVSNATGSARRPGKVHTHPGHRDRALLHLLLALQLGLRLAPLVFFGLCEAGVGAPLLRCLRLRARELQGNARRRWVGITIVDCELRITGSFAADAGLCDSRGMDGLAGGLLARTL